jgi:hypothetical protein
MTPLPAGGLVQKEHERVAEQRHGQDVAAQVEIESKV